MPYHWNNNSAEAKVLELTAHRSLPKSGFVFVIGITTVFLCLPLLGLLGTVGLWAMLPPMVVTVWALWVAIQRSYKDGQVSELLFLELNKLRLIHSPVRGKPQEWDCNVFWVTAELHKSGGPVPNYITLHGNGRRVELGRFLSEDERETLFEEIQVFLKKSKSV